MNRPIGGAEHNLDCTTPTGSRMQECSLKDVIIIVLSCCCRLSLAWWPTGVSPLP